MTVAELTQRELSYCKKLIDIVYSINSSGWITEIRDETKESCVALVDAIDGMLFALAPGKDL